MQMLFHFKLGRTAYFFVFFCCCFTFFSATYGTVYSPYRIKTIVIDPGHGGHDSGCLGSSSKEKTIALQVALKLGAMIEEKFPDVRVVYTRKTDEFIELHERAAIANRNHADLFICIHCNSGGPTAFGVETYVMGLHKSDDNLNVAKRENASVLLEKDFKQKYDGFDPNSPEANIIFSLYQNAYLTQSLKFAAAVQQQAEEYAGRFNRGVKQAGFLVLYKTAMPSVLIETGFLTNNAEEKYLITEKGQNNMAISILKAFEEYKLDMEIGGADPKTSTGVNNDLKKNLPELKTDSAKKTGGSRDSKVHPGEPSTKKPIFTSTPKDSATAKETVVPKTVVKETPKLDSVKTSSTTIETVAKKAPEKVIVEPKETPKPKIDNKPKTAPKEELSIEKEETLPVLFYTVQLAAIPSDNSNEMKRFDLLNDIHKFTAENGYIRVCSGIYTQPSKAQESQSKWRGKGYPDAFVTPYYKGKRISMKEAGLLKK